MRGDGPGSSLGEGCSPGSGEGPHAAVGGWRYSRGHSRRGTAAPPLTGCGPAWRPADSPSPPPPLPRGEMEPEGQPGREHSVSGDRQLRGARQLPTQRGPCPELLTPEPTAAVQHAVDCLGWQPETGAMTHEGWTAQPRAPASCRTHPVPTAVATAAVPAPAAPPWGGTRDRTPAPAGGCLYAHRPRGRPGARRWPWVLFGGGVQPGQWRGSPRGSGGLAVQQGAQPPRHCGSPSHRVRPAWRPADPPPPPP